VSDQRVFSNIPVPDPSLITTEQIERAKTELRLEFQHRLESVEKITQTRLDGIDRASVLLDANVNRVPTLLDRVTAQIKELFDEKFIGIQKQLAERDVRAENDKVAAQTAVNAALQAQKEAAAAQNEANSAAITKSEAATIKQIDGIQQFIKSSNDATNDRIADLKGRLDRGEGASRGGAETRTENRSNGLYLWAIVGGVVGLIGLFISIVLAVVVIAHLGSGSGQAPPTVVSPAVVPVGPK
jgi:hypothetical protein